MSWLTGIAKFFTSGGTMKTVENIATEWIETDLEKANRIEDLLITEGVMIPGTDLVHYMTRNASYMKLIESQQFKDSGIELEEVLDVLVEREGLSGIEEKKSRGDVDGL